ncbi:MAG: nicotinate phosphoribosyltransferase [Clostridia bacterium]|nr:nicotinate phosphoribosyltransferase [Clostridia bacterium]
MQEQRNLTMLTDLYELTMIYGYFKHDMQSKEVVFDLFFRKSAGKSIYAVVAGLEQVIDYIENLHFSDEDIAYLRSLNLFDEEFFKFLQRLKFTGELYAMKEGEIAFAGEPLIRVKAPIIEAQLLETALLNIINHQTLIATKASRVVYAAQGDGILEFGLRRAQGPDAGIYGARAAVIGGCVGTSNVLTGQMFDVPIKGTHAHSWVMAFPSELDAFRAYANVFPDSCLLLVDTYDTLRSGVPNAITIFKELREKGHKPVGIRLDSGDLAYLSKEARNMLDAAGFEEAKIFASNDLDEYIIWDLKAQGAKIDVWGVGTALITSKGSPALGGVYKLVSEYDNEGNELPKIKKSDNPEKITTPGYKKVYRFYEKETGKAIADYIALDGETINESEPITIFDPNAVWKQMTLTNFHAKELLCPVFIDGECVYKKPSLKEIAKYTADGIDSLWDEFKRLTNPQIYKVDLSQKLYDTKQRLLNEIQEDSK